MPDVYNVMYLGLLTQYIGSVQGTDGSLITFSYHSSGYSDYFDFLRAAATYGRRPVGQRGPFYSSIALPTPLTAPAPDVGLLVTRSKQ
jgi:hypothetical protein